jgi:P pilus assembly chaperone PapD
MKVSPYLLILLVLTTLVSGTHAAEVTLDRTRYVPGEPITVRFKNAPGNTKDWVGLYVEGKSAQDYFASVCWRTTATSCWRRSSLR